MFITVGMNPAPASVTDVCFVDTDDAFLIVTAMPVPWAIINVHIKNVKNFFISLGDIIS